MKLFIYKH